MKTLTFTAILFISTFVYSQYDYFRWTKSISNIPGVQNSPKSGLANDGFGNCYYINQVSKKICSIYGEVMSNAIGARTNSNLIYHLDPVNGDGVFYIGNNNRIYALQWDFISGSWLFNTEYSTFKASNVASNSFIDVKSKNEIYYVRSLDYKVAYIKKTGTSLSNLVMNSSALPAHQNSNIVHFGDKVYYIANNSKLSYLNNIGGAWVSTNLNSDIIASDSKIQISPIGNQVFYVRNYDKRICSYWGNGAPTGFNVLDESSVPVIAGSDINVSSLGDEVSYIGVDGNVHIIAWDGCRWLDNTLNNTSNINSNYNTFSLAADDQIFYSDGTNIMTLTKNSAANNFVYRKGSRLELNGSKYNAKIVDYSAAIYRRNGQLFLGPTPNYDSDNSDWVCLTSGSCNLELNSHFQNMKDAGFNAIRINGLTVAGNNTFAQPNVDPNLYVQVWDIPYNYSPGDYLPFPPTLVNVSSIETQLFSKFNDIVNLAGSYDLKVNFFVAEKGQENYNSICHTSYGDYFNRFADNFKNNPNLFMYSLFLEVDYHYGGNYNATILNKDYVCSTVNSWYDKIRQVDDNHLVSIGVTNPYSIVSFDPGIMNVDVITFHIYPDMKYQTFSNYNYQSFYRDLWWVSNIMNKQIRKPWVIGETGIIAVSNPSAYTIPDASQSGFNLLVDYQTQKDFAIMSLQNIFLAGASGYGWWQYKDDGKFGSINYGEFFGLVDTYGNNKVIIANGNSVFNTTAIVNGCNESVVPNDYFNHSNNFQYELNGYIRDINGFPISEASISYRAPNGKIYSTYSASSGYFLLKSEYPINEIDVWAIGKYTYKTPNPINWATHYLSFVSCSSPYGMVVSDNLGENTFIYSTLEQKCEIFPNPGNGIFNLKFNHDLLENTSIRVYDMYGVLVMNSILSNSRYEKIDLNNFTNGIYIVTIKNGDYSETLKIIKQ